MKLATLDWWWGGRIAAIVDDQAVDLNASYTAWLCYARGIPKPEALRQAAVELPAELVALLRLGPVVWDRVRAVVAWVLGPSVDPVLREGLVWPLNRVRYAPTIPNPSKIWCQGANYRDHKQEMARRLGHQPEPDRLRGFLKAPSSLIGAGDDIRYPAESGWVEHEMELGVVIGQWAHNVAEREAMAYVAGFLAFDDISARDVAVREQNRLDRGKGFDTFGVMGPWLVTPEEIPDPYRLEIVLKVNGQIRQQGSTKDMIYSIAEQIAWLSRAMTLYPGDIISTGTPAGTGRIQPGDLVEGTVTGLGWQRNRVVAAPGTQI